MKSSAPRLPAHAAASTAALAHLIWQRRATPAFAPVRVPRPVIAQALALAAEAPSGYNFQPWRFLVVTTPAGKARLRAAALDQVKITEASVMIIAFGQRQGWKKNVDEIARLAGRRRGQDTAQVKEQKAAALAFLGQLPPAVWLNRQVMIGFTHLMLAFEALGWDTAPMEGFEAAKVRRAFRLPADAEVVALLAVGRALHPHTPHPGRLPVRRIAFSERITRPFSAQPFVRL